MKKILNPPLLRIIIADYMTVRNNEIHKSQYDAVHNNKRYSNVCDQTWDEVKPLYQSYGHQIIRKLQ